MKQALFSIKTVFRAAPMMAAVMALLVISNGALGPLLAFLIKSIIDEVSTQSRWQYIGCYLLLFICTMLLMKLREVLEELIKVRFVHKIREKIVPELFSAFENMPYEYLENQDTVNLISRIGSAPEVMLYDIYHNMLFLPNLAVSLIGYSLIYLELGVLFFLLLSAAGIFTGVVSAKIYKENNKLRINQSGMKKHTSYLSGLITSRKAAAELRLYEAHEYLNELWRDEEKTMFNERRLLILRQQGLRVCTILCELCFMAVVMAMSLNMYRADEITYGSLVSLISQIPSVLQIVTWYIPFVYNSCKDNMVRTGEFLKLYSYCNSAGSAGNAAMMPAAERDEISSIEFKNVYFRYPGSTDDVLRGVSFTMDKNKKYALVGENGAGKSTIIKLLLGLYVPSSGTILFDGINAEFFTKEQRAKMVSAVFQENVMFEMSLKENIGIGNPEELWNTDEIMEAVQRTDIDKIRSQDTLEKTVGKLFEDGLEFSDGEKRKIVTARGLFAKTDFTVLDEPTSSLDPLSEVRFYEEILQNYKDKSCIIISHRLGCAKLSDVIFVLADGVIKEQGTHGELMDKNGRYAAMFQAQAKWYSDDFSSEQLIRSENNMEGTHEHI